MATIQTMPGAEARSRPMTAEEKKVIIASSAGTIFEWYDFYLYGALAGVIGAQFFTAFDESTRNIFALLAFAAGFLVRPFGALFFGRLGDLIGRKYTFLVTILIMGLSTFFVGLLPNYETIGVIAPITLIVLRLLQGLALGGEYGGAAIYVAEHAPSNQRGYFTAWIQTTATLGLLLSLLVIMFTTIYVNANWPSVTLPGGGTRTAFADWGWRIPFLASIFLLAISLYIRLKMNESPAFLKMKEEGTQSKAPLDEAFGTIPSLLVGLIALLIVGAIVMGYMGIGGAYPLLVIPTVIALIAFNMSRFGNGRIAIIALLGLVAGQAVVWYTGQFYALFFLQQILKVDNFTANVMVAWSLIIGTGFFIFFGSLSDRIGRKPIILGGCLLAALLYLPVQATGGGIFGWMSTVANPALMKAHDTISVVVTANKNECSFQFNPTGTAKFTSGCDTVKAALARASVKYSVVDAPVGTAASVKIGNDAPISSREAQFGQKLTAALTTAGYPAASNPSVVQIKIEPKDGLWNMGKLFDIFTAQRLTIIGILTLMVILVTMVYGPIAAALVELFPTRIRYSGLSLPYHIGNGWFGGLMPATSFAMVAQTGDPSFGLWYPIAIALMTVVIGLFFVPETYKRDIFDQDAAKR
jgi:MFS family permease